MKKDFLKLKKLSQEEMNAIVGGRTTEAQLEKWQAEQKKKREEDVQRALMAAAQAGAAIIK